MMMEEIKLKLNEKGHGVFYIMDEGEQLGEMVVSVADSKLTVHHTEVLEKAEGKGFAKKLLNAMVDYARKNKLKVIPLCAYVHAQFKRHPEEYVDVWNKDEKNKEHE
jgi:predicted GNAT family acetyltransferase